MKMTICLLAALALITPFYVHSTTPAQRAQDTLPTTYSLDKKALPFTLDPRKRLPQEEIEDKKTGTFLTGIPRFEFDPIRGFGVGGNLNLFVNKDQSDPFFEYSPYRHKLNAEFFIFQNGRVRYAFNYDAPYLFDSKWRLRMDAVLWEDPNAQYWGIGQQSLQPLQFTDKRTGVNRSFRKMKDYEENLALALPQGEGYVTDYHYNHFYQNEQLYNVLAERTFYGGRLRLMFGYEALFTSFQSYQGKEAEEAYTLDGKEVTALNGPTLVDKQKADGTWDRFQLSGFNNNEKYNFTSMLAAALIWDTRDFEPDPTQGLFLQYSHEYSAPWLGSDFDFHKFMVQGQWFHTLAQWRNNRSRLTFAGLAAFGYIFGNNINFIEMWDLSSQAEAGGILVLGGERSLRGFREARFLAPTVGLINLEMRAKFYDFYFLQQHFSTGLTGFYDLGTVWDSPSNISLKDWRSAPGLGLRIHWNQSTVIRLDYAISREGSQTFFGFGHIF